MNQLELYAALVESSDDAIVSKDLEGRVLSWNPAAERLFGFTCEEMIGQPMLRIFPPGCEAEEDEILGQIRAGQRVPFRITGRCHKSGEDIPVLLSVSPVRDAAGTIVGACTTMRDAREQLETQRKLDESERFFRMMADNISQLAWIARADGHIFWYNRRWHEYTGRPHEEMEGWGWKAVHHPDHLDRVVKRIQHSWDTGEEWEDIFPLRRHDGIWRWFLSRAKPIRNADGTVAYWFGTNTDITEQREQAEQIQLLLREVNHRSKNMLAKVQALARRTACGDPEFVRQFEDRVGSLVVNQDILVRRDWRDIPIEELVRMQLAFVAEAPGRIEFSGPDGALNPRAAEVVGMALHELATNALKYGALSVEGGRLAIRWDVDGADRFVIEWTESDGPSVVEPDQTGFGTTIIRDVPARTLAADVSLEYRSDGLRWRCECDGQVFAREMPDGIEPFALRSEKR
jgi:PAS domain S-box-containing protein